MDPVGDRTARLTRTAVTVLGYTLLVIVWGYVLRISESGDGCGTDWPLCRGELVPGTPSPGAGGVELPTWVEFIHRASSGVALLLVAGLYAWTRRLHPAGHAVRRAAGASLLFTLSESLFGAILVVFGLVAEDISTARILIRPFHVANTFLLMASLGLTAWWSFRGTTRMPAGWAVGAGRPGPRSVPWLPPLAVLLLAASGSWTGLATTAFPAESVSEGFGQYLDPEHLLIYLRMIHPLVALGAVVVLFRFAAIEAAPGVTGSLDPWRRRLALAVALLTAAQIVAGPLTILLLQPPWLRVFHLFLADLLWLAVVILVAIRAEKDATAG